MNCILVAALLATTALATPLRLQPVPDTTNVTIHTRQGSVKGTDSGISISTYTKANCKGDGLSGEQLLYDTQVAQQFRSYSLSDDLGSDQTLAIYADASWKSTGSKAVDTSLNGDTSAACSQSVYDLKTSSQKQNMDALAETWLRSGERDEDLYKGSNEDIIRELKAWIIARKARNQANMQLLWGLFETDDAITRLRDQYGTIEDLRIAPFKAKRVKEAERVNEFKEERDKLSLRAEFLIDTLVDRGFEWFVIPFTPQWTEMDTEVCSFLSTQDPSFDANRQLEVLEMEGEVAEWRLELARREAHEVARRLGVSHTSSDYDLPAPVNVTGLLPRPFPRPRAKDSPTDRLSPVPMDTIEEESTEPEETAEDITLRTNSTNTTEEHTKVERRPKTMIRNIERRKAKLRTRAAAKAEADKAVGLTGDDGGDLMNINDE